MLTWSICRSSNALFDLVWQQDGALAFRANNGRYVITKRSGHLYANSDVIDENCKYYFYLINRPILVLKSEQGFVGYKSAGNPKLECNKATYECIQVERAEKGVIHFKGEFKRVKRHINKCSFNSEVKGGINNQICSSNVKFLIISLC